MPSEVQTYQNNLNQVTDALLLTRSGVATGINALEIADQVLSALKEIDTNADALKSIASGLETALNLVSKISGPLGPITKALKRAIDLVEDRAAEVEAAAEAAQPPESQFDDILDLIEASTIALEGQLIVIDAEVRELGSIKAGLDDAVSVVENTAGMDIPIEFNSAIAAANTTVEGINAAYQPVIDALNTMASARQAVADGLNAIIQPGRDVINALASVKAIVDSVDFLSGPLGVLEDILSPVQWALDLVGLVYDATIGLVVNPIIEASGLTDLFSAILDEVGLDNLPSLDIFPDVKGPLDELIAELTGGVVDPLVAAIADVREIIGDALLGPVNDAPDNLSQLVIGDDDNPPPNDEPGTEIDALGGNDLVAGGLGNDTLNGGEGDDLLIGGEGDDIIDGGAGFNAAVFFGDWQEFRFGYGNDGELIVSQSEWSGGRQGVDRLQNIDKVIFANRTFDFVEFENFFFTDSTPEQGDSIRGNDDANYIFGNIGEDTLYGEGGNDYLFGGRGNSDFSGGDNTLYGGADDDLLDGGTSLGNDYFGGPGIDTVTYETYGANGSGNSIIYLALTDDAARTPYTPEFYETYDSIENLTAGESIKSWIWGDAGNNVLTGGRILNRINGFEGDDTIIGRDGNRDQLVGGAGDDYVDGGEGQNLFIAGPGDDTYIHVGNANHELWYGGVTETSEWNDQAYNWRAVENSETVETNEDYVRLAVMGFLEEDVPSLIPSSVVVDAGAGVVQKFNASGVSMGTDTLIDIDTITASQGNDTIYSATSATTLNGGGGNDLFIGVDQAPPTDGQSVSVNGTIMEGDAGNDVFQPGEGVFTIGGGEGQDRIEFTKDGFTSFAGGNGFDTADFSGSDRAWDIDATPFNNAQGFTPGDTRDPDTGEYANVDIKSIRSTETIIGSRFDDILTTSNGLPSGGSLRTINGFDGNDKLISQYSSDRYDPFSHLLLGGDGDDMLYGSRTVGPFLDFAPLFGEFLSGEAGNDRLWDVAGGQTSAIKKSASFAGGEGNDRFYFAAHNVVGIGHTIDGGDGFDAVDYSEYAVALTLDLSTSTSVQNIEQVRGTQFGDDLAGDEGTNRLIGQNGSDALKGFGGDDIIYTGDGNDTAEGGTGNDLIFAARDNNDVSGGAGIDQLSFNAYQRGEEQQSDPGWTPEETLGTVDADLADGTARFSESADGPAHNTDFSGIENLTGGWLNDTLRGDSRDNVINGGAQGGNDLIEGRTGNDFLSGGDGNDTLYGDNVLPDTPLLLTNTDAVSLNRDTENQQAAVLDVYDMPTDAVTVEMLFRANDGELPTSYYTFFSYAGGSPVDQEEFLIFGYTTSFTLSLGIRINGNNYLSNVPTSSILDGDIHRLSASYDGATGAVALYLNGAEIVSGTTNAGGLGANGRVLIAQDQDADGILRPVKTMKGEVADIRVWNEVRSAAEIDALAFTDGLDPTANPALVTNWVPDAQQTGVIEDVIAGADLHLLGAPGFARFTNDDVLDGGAGADMLFGGAGVDLANYSGSDARVEVDLTTGTGNSGHAAGDVLDSIEDVTGSAFNDLIVGDGVANTLDGGGGRDNIAGRAGNDRVMGGTGDDLLNGGNGDDTLTGGPDTLEQPDPPEEPITDNDAMRGNGGHDVLLGGAGLDTAFGGTGEDYISGGDDNDSLLGQGQNDTILGDAGDDILRGGSGNDQLEGGVGNDDLFGNGNNDTLVGGEGDDFLQGAAGADILIGEAGHDTLLGGAGSDTLDGGTGDDLLNGGANADFLLFGLGSGNDTIAGFEDNIDTIEIAQALAGAQTVSDLLADASITSQIGASVVMDFGDGDILRVNNVGLSDLADDIVIV